MKDADDQSSPPVVVELFVLRCTTVGALAYRRLSTRLGRDETPTAAAIRLGRVNSGDAEADLVVHSTSWRQEPGGAIVLTYVITPDPEPDRPAVPLTDLQVARGEDANDPVPAQVDPEHVAAHAIRHLAFLLDTDPAARRAFGVDSALVATLATVPRANAGQVFPDPVVPATR